MRVLQVPCSKKKKSPDSRKFCADMRPCVCVSVRFRNSDNQRFTQTAPATAYWPVTATGASYWHLENHGSTLLTGLKTLFQGKVNDQTTPTEDNNHIPEVPTAYCNFWYCPNGDLQLDRRNKIATSFMNSF